MGQIIHSGIYLVKMDIITQIVKLLDSIEIYFLLSPVFWINNLLVKPSHK